MARRLHKYSKNLGSHEEPRFFTKKPAVNIASHAILEVSSTLEWGGYDFRKENAVDGNFEPESETCNCCYISRGENKPTFTATYAGHFRIEEIRVIGRQDNPTVYQLLSHTNVYINENISGATWNSTSNTVSVSKSVVVQTIKIERPKESGIWNLAICEFEVYSSGCDSGFYGDKCNQECPANCAISCELQNGHCVGGCIEGYQGDKCENECSHGRFGDNCSAECHCLGSANCDNIDGICDNRLCAAGWMLQNCSQACEHGAFGLNCSSNCHCLSNASCDNVDGICENGLCMPGWQNDSCSAECSHGRFGDNCSAECHCLGSANCDNIDGICDNRLCAAGWMLQNCSQACEHGAFGLNCSSNCHCLSNASCDNVDGICENGLCMPGWQNDSCSAECSHGRFGDNCSAECHCLGSANCDNIDGICDNRLCAAGWMLQNCSQACVHGAFGLNCSSNCHCLSNASCDNVDGICENGICMPGWQNDSCSAECGHKHFGLNCSFVCHCHGNTGCNHISGNCYSQGCDAGYNGLSCDKECAYRQFGHNCNSTCYCSGNSTCQKENGTCYSGICEPGWQSDSCNVAVEASPAEGPNGGAAVGAGIGATVVIIIAVVALAIVVRRRMMRNSDKGTSSTMLHDHTRSFDNIDRPEVERQNGLTEGDRSKLDNALEGDSNTYCNFAPQGIEITLRKLWDYIQEHKQDDNKLFVEEFKTLPYGLVQPYTDSQKPANKKKNRYREMYAYDHSRVILDITGPEQTDYINACHVHGFGKPKKFIASQGPMDAMVNDFWRMVWQQNVNRIVMLTNPTEAGSVKCIVYWPEKGNAVHGELQVILVNSENFKDYIRRDLIITMGTSERKLSQFHFKSWPDKDVPDNTWCLVQFWRAVNQDRGHDDDSPIIVHCSAGVGRTGTYIALDYLFNQMKEVGSIRPLQAVLSLREERVNMVQTNEQYAFLHEAVADALLIGTHYVFSSQFPELYNFLSKREPGSQQTRFARQLDMVSDILREKVEQGVTTGADMIYANTPAVTEGDAYRPKLKNRISSHLQEMGAMFLPCFSGANIFLVGKSPTANSLVEFWSLVQEQNVKTVISLCETSAKNYQTACSLGVDTGALKGHFSANMLQESSKKAFTERTFVFHEDGKIEDEDRTTVKVFDFTAWKTGYSTPDDALAVLDLVDAVQSWQPHISESQPLLIHCRTGTKRSGILCLVLSELARLKREDGQVNVLDSLIRLKRRNRELIHNVEQYRFCHDVILRSIQQQQQHLQLHQLDGQNIYANM